MASDIGIASSKLVSLVMKRILPSAKAAVTKLQQMHLETGEVRRFRGTTEYEPHDFYDVDVFRRCVAIADTFDRLEDVERFIRHVPSAETLREEGVSQDRWMQYHYAYHIVLIASLLDLSLLLVNSVLRLGYPERLCTVDSIGHNSWTKTYGIESDLAELKKATESHRIARNLYLHRGESVDIAAALASERYGDLTLIAFANATSKKPIAPPELLDAAFHLHASKLVPKLAEGRNNLAAAVLKLFERLAPIFEATARKLHSTARRAKRGA